MKVESHIKDCLPTTTTYILPGMESGWQPSAWGPRGLLGLNSEVAVAHDQSSDILEDPRARKSVPLKPQPKQGISLLSKGLNPGTYKEVIEMQTGQELGREERK